MNRKRNLNVVVGSIACCFLVTQCFHSVISAIVCWNLGKDTGATEGAGSSGCLLRAVFGFQSQSADALPLFVGHAGSFVDLQVLVKSVSSGNLDQDGTEVRFSFCFHDVSFPFVSFLFCCFLCMFMCIFILFMFMFIYVFVYVCI